MVNQLPPQHKTLRNHGQRNGNRVSQWHVGHIPPPECCTSCTYGWGGLWPNLAIGGQCISVQGLDNFTTPQANSPAAVSAVDREDNKDGYDPAIQGGPFVPPSGDGGAGGGTTLSSSFVAIVNQSPPLPCWKRWMRQPSPPPLATTMMVFF